MMREQIPQGLENLIQSIGDMPIPENGQADISIKIRGDDVMDRRLFAGGPVYRQEGGPMQAPMQPPMQPPMEPPMQAPPEQVMQLEEVEQQAQAEGEQVGLDYLAQTMDGIDAAEDVEEMINAIRGNNMPIEARRMELADFVGRDDAMATPETVLAMVQPTIMMSEEGAMSSGIGDLMRQMTEDVDMSTEGGAPTDMGEGVGGLMMAAAPMTQEPVQGFAQGGAVKKFDDGGGATTGLQSIYEQYLPFFQNIAGATEEERQKDLGLAMAKAGFQFASGRGPKGENIAGRPFLSQLGTVGTQFADDVGTISRERRKEGVGLRTLAAQSAISSQTAALESQRELQRDKLKAGYDLQVEYLKNLMKPGEFDVEEVGQNIDGMPIYQILNVKTGETVNIGSLNKNTTQGRATNDVLSQLGIVNTPILGPGDSSTVVSETAAQTGSDKRTLGLPLGTPGERELRNLILPLDRYTSDTLSDTDVIIYETRMQEYFQPKLSEKGLVTFEKKPPLKFLQAIAKRKEAGKELNLDPDFIEYAVQKTKKPFKTAADTLEEANQALSEFELLSEEFDAAETFGMTESALASLASGAEAFRDLTTSRVFSDTDTATRGDAINQSRFYLDKLANVTLKVLLTELESGRPLKSVTDVLIDQVNQIRPGGFKTDKGALQAMRALLPELEKGKLMAQRVSDAPKSFPSKDVNVARSIMVEFDQLIKAYGTVIDALEIEVGEVQDVGVKPVDGSTLTQPVIGVEKGTAEEAADYFKKLNAGG
tara:strand:- start:4953 stop:7247 length:2295 start_codon:yes stop_codon:yes gene_type:complete